jgi:PKD repeat protein
MCSAQPFPSFIPGGMAWFSADSIQLPDNTTIAEWKNNYNHYPVVLEQTDTRYRPLYVENALNGKPVLRFNGSNQYLNGGAILDMGTEGQSIFVVTKLNANSNNRTLLAKSANGTAQFSQNKYALRCTTNNRLFLEYTDIPPTQILFSESLIDYAILTTTVDLQQGAVSLFTNSKQTDTRMRQPNYEFTSEFDFLVGAYNNAGGTPVQSGTQFNGDIAEIIVFNRAVTLQERQTIENYLRLKYFPGTERLPISLGGNVFQLYSLENLILEVPDSSYFTNFEWNTGETTRTITAEKSGKYSVKVTDDWGWEYTDTILFAKPDITQLSDTILCIGDTITWDCGIDGNYTYRWSTGETTQSIRIHAAGEYSVEVEDTLGNVARSTVAHVTIDNFPAEASLGGDAELCAGNFLELVSGETSNIVSYTWNTGANTARLQLHEGGTYWLKAVNANECVAHDTVTITLKENAIAPEVDFTVENACEHQISILRQNAITTDGSHIIKADWTIGGETFDGLTHEHTFALGEHSVQLQVTSDKGCKASLHDIITINPVPQGNFSPIIACRGIEVEFQPEVSISAGTITRYEWKYAGKTIIAHRIKEIFETVGEVPITLEVTSDKACKNTIQNTVLVRNAPELNITHSAACEQEPTFFFDRTIYTTINNAVSRTWFVNNHAEGNNSVFSDTLNIPSTVRYTVRTMNGCELSWEKTIVPASQPQPLFDSVYSCPNTAITLTDSSKSAGDEIAERTWYINNVVYHEKNPIVQFTEAGTYPVVLTVKTENKCTNSGNSAIVIEPEPKASFIYTPLEGVVSVPMAFTSTSTNASYYTWTFSGTKEYETETLSHTFTDTADTRVQLTAYSPHGCSDSTEHIIPVISATHRLSITDCTLEATVYGTVLRIHVKNAGNTPVHHIQFVIVRNAASPDTTIWNSTLAPDASSVFIPEHFMQDSPDFVSIQAHILNSQGEMLFSTNFAKDFTNAFTVYSVSPVPATDIVYVKFASISQIPLTITLYNMQGTVIFSTQINPVIGFNETAIDVAYFAPGRYECHITQGDNTVKKAILIR